MTIKEDTSILWDNGGNKLWLYSVPSCRKICTVREARKFGNKNRGGTEQGMITKCKG